MNRDREIQFDTHLAQMREMVQAGTHDFTYEKKPDGSRVLTVKQVAIKLNLKPVELSDFQPHELEPVGVDAAGNITPITESEPKS